MTAATAAHATARGRKILLSSVIGLPVLGIQVGSGLLLVTLAWRALGSQGFGLWAAITAFMPIVALGDLGVGSALVSVVASALGRDDPLAARRASATAIAVMMVVAILLAVVMAAAYAWVDWPAWFKLSPDTPLNPGLALVAYVGCRLVFLPLSAGARIRTGLQENFVNNAWDAAGVFLSLAFFYLASHLGADLPLLLLASGSGPLAAALGNWIGLSGRGVIPRPGDFDWAQLRSLLHLGILFFTLSLSSMLASAADNLVAIRLLGPSATAQIAVASKVFMVGQSVLMVALMPLWPAFAEAIARRDGPWVNRALRFGVLASLGGGAALSACFLVGTNYAVLLWLGPDAVLPTGLLWANACWLLLQAVGNVAAMFLNGARVMRFQIVQALSFGALAFGLKIVAAPILGPAGIVWATVIAYAGLVIPLYVWFVRRWLTRADWG
jgi:O-antigen/teichoic acid export membrane protein